MIVKVLLIDLIIIIDTHHKLWLVVCLNFWHPLSQFYTGIRFVKTFFSNKNNKNKIKGSENSTQDLPRSHLILSCLLRVHFSVLEHLRKEKELQQHCWLDMDLRLMRSFPWTLILWLANRWAYNSALHALFHLPTGICLLNFLVTIPGRCVPREFLKKNIPGEYKTTAFSIKDKFKVFFWRYIT